MENSQDSIITKYLISLIEDLECKLDYPKNTWKRREQIQAEIADAQKHLDSVSVRNRKRSSFSDRTSSNRLAQGRSNLQRSEAPKTPSRPLPRVLEVSYR